MPLSPARAWWPRRSTSRELKGYRTGGTIHFVINNQIGFTTSPALRRARPVLHRRRQDDRRRRSSTSTATTRRRWSTSSRMAIEFRQQFKQDVVIDMFCYRRYGHNEGDEPAFTQPLMYKAIAQPPDRRARSTPSSWSTRACVTRTRSTRWSPRFAEQAAKAIRRGRQRLQAQQGRLAARAHGPACDAASARRSPRRDRRQLETLQRGRRRRSRPCPTDFNVNRKLARQLEAKRAGDRDAARASTGRPARRWRSARCCSEGTPVRLSRPGRRPRHLLQRHAVLIDQDNESRVHPAQQHRAKARRASRSIDSPLSEAACSASNTATRWPTRTRWCSGKRSSAISPTARRSSSTSSSLRRIEVAAHVAAW